jgi:hypothetical protein
MAAGPRGPDIDPRQLLGYGAGSIAVGLCNGTALLRNARSLDQI